MSRTPLRASPLLLLSMAALMGVLAAAITVHVAAQLWTYSWIAYDNLRGPWGVDRDTRSILGLVWVAESCVALLAYWIRVLSAAKGRMK